MTGLQLHLNQRYIISVIFSLSTLSLFVYLSLSCIIYWTLSHMLYFIFILCNLLPTCCKFTSSFHIVYFMSISRRPSKNKFVTCILICILHRLFPLDLHHLVSQYIGDAWFILIRHTTYMSCTFCLSCISSYPNAVSISTSWFNVGHGVVKSWSPWKKKNLRSLQQEERHW